MKSARAYLVFGDDEYLVSAKAREIVSKLVPAKDASFALETVDGRVDAADGALKALGQCMEALLTPGFFGAGKVVWLKDAWILSDTPAGKSEAVKARVGELADLLRKGGLAGTILVISAPKLDKRQSLYRVCAELGEVQEFTIPEKAYLAEREATNRLNGIMGELGLNMDGDAAAAFLERTGIETRQMVCEAEKMKTYLGGRRNVELADVKAVAVFSREAQAWDLADAMGEKDLARALGLVRQLLFQASKESFPGLLMTLENRIRELMIYREAMDRGWLVDQGGGVGSGRKTGVEWKKLPEDVDGLMSRRLGKDPRQTHPYRAGLLARQAKRFSMPELRRNQRRVMETYEQLVSGQAQASTAIEVLLIGMLGKKRS